MIQIPFLKNTLPKINMSLVQKEMKDMNHLPTIILSGRYVNFPGSRLYLGGGNSNIVYFHPEPWGNWSNFDEHIFSNGLVQPPTSYWSSLFFSNGRVLGPSGAPSFIWPRFMEAHWWDRHPGPWWLVFSTTVSGGIKSIKNVAVTYVCLTLQKRGEGGGKKFFGRIGWGDFWWFSETSQHEWGFFSDAPRRTTPSHTKERRKNRWRLRHGKVVAKNIKQKMVCPRKLT